MSETKEKKFTCRTITTGANRAAGKECFNGGTEPVDVSVIKSEAEFQAAQAQASQQKAEYEQKQVEEKQTKKELKEMKITVEDQLKNAQCGLYTEVDPRIIKCPEGTKAIKYHYDQSCRDIQTITSKDPIKEAKNYNMLFCSTKNMPTVPSTALPKRKGASAE